MDRSSLGTMTKYRRKRLAAAYKDDRLRPALTYATNVSPTDVGLPDEFGCVIWLANSTHYRIAIIYVIVVLHLLLGLRITSNIN